MRDHSRSSTTSGSVASTAVEGVPVGAQRRGQHAGVAAVVLGARRRVPVAEPVELLRVDRVHREAARQQALRHRPARRLDRHADLRRRHAAGGLGDPGRHRRQARAAVLERLLAAHRAGVVEEAGLVLPRSPVHADEPPRLGRVCHDWLLAVVVGFPGNAAMPAGPCTGARSADSSLGFHRGRSARAPVLRRCSRHEGTGGRSRRAARLRAWRREAVENGTGDGLVPSRCPRRRHVRCGRPQGSPLRRRGIREIDRRARICGEQRP